MSYFSWQRLNAREKKMLVLGGIVTIIALIYFFIWQPIQTSKQQLTNQISQQQALVDWVSLQQIEIEQLSTNITSLAEDNKQPLFTVVEDNLAEAGLYTQTTQLNSSNVNSVTIQSDDIDFDKFISLLTELGSKYNIEVIQGNIQRSLEVPGIARVNVTLAASS